MLKKLVFVLLVGLPLLWSQPAMPAPPAQPASPEEQAGFGERIEINVVNVEVYVTDKGGRRVTDLRQEDFTLYEDGRRMDLTNFSAFELPAQAPAGPAGASVETAASVPDPVHLVVYIDDQNLMPAHRNRVLHQLREALAQRLSPEDRVMVVTYDQGLKVRLPFTQDRAALVQALEGVEKIAATGALQLERSRRTTLAHVRTIQELGLLDPDPATRTACPMDIVNPVRDYAHSVRHEVLRSIGGLLVLVNSLSGLPGRKAVLHVSDGITITPGEELFQMLHDLCGNGNEIPMPGVLSAENVTMGGMQRETLRDVAAAAASGGKIKYRGEQAPIEAQSYSTTRQWSELAVHANTHRVTLYTLQASGAEPLAGSVADLDGNEMILRSVASIEEQNRKGSLTALANDTGGRVTLNVNDIKPALAGMQEDFGSFYSLGFSPPHNGDGREHRLEVRVARPGLRVRYRQSYRDKPPLERAVDRTLASLLYGYEDNPLDIQVEIGQVVPAPANKFAVTIRLRIPLYKLAILTQPDHYEGKLRLFVATRNEDGGSSPVRQVEIPIRIPRQQVLTAMGQSYLYELTLHLGPGEQQVAVGVRDEMTTTTSYFGRTVQVGEAALAKAPGR